MPMTRKQASNWGRSGRRSGGAGGRKAHLVVSVGRVVLEERDTLAVQAPIVPLPLFGRGVQKVRWSALGWGSSNSWSQTPPPSLGPPPKGPTPSVSHHRPL